MAGLVPLLCLTSSSSSETGNQLLFTGALATLVIVPSLLHFFFTSHRRRKRGSASLAAAAAGGGLDLFPPGPPAWPILGHLPILQSGCPHRILAALSRSPSYGPLLGLRLGSRPAVVVSSAAVAKEILLNQDLNFASRPPYQYVDNLHYGYDSAVLFGGYSSHWAIMRKFYIHQLFTPQRIQDLQFIRNEEMARLLESLDASSRGTQAVDVGKFMADMSYDVASRLVWSKTMSEAAELQGESLHRLVNAYEQEAAPTLGDLIPWLRWKDWTRWGHVKQLKKRMDKVIDTMIAERREDITKAAADSTIELPKDFLQALLSKESTCFTNDQTLTTPQIKTAILDMLLAGTHTTTLTLEWAMAELLCNPRCFHIIREEIDEVVGCRGDLHQRLVRDEDLPKLPYLQKVVKEVLRLHPVAPLLLPRISRSKCKVGKYVLPEGTHTFVNVWAMGRDPEVWANAEDFWPERFEGEREEVDVMGQHYELLPFGSGTRMCPAASLALAVVQGTLANLVHAFTWELPPGQTPQTVDMTERRGISISKAAPLLAILKPR